MSDKLLSFSVQYLLYMLLFLALFLLFLLLQHLNISKQLTNVPTIHKCYYTHFTGRNTKA